MVCLCRLIGKETICGNLIWGAVTATIGRLDILSMIRLGSVQRKQVWFAGSNETLTP